MTQTIIALDEQLPANGTKCFLTSADNIKLIQFNIVEGTRRFAHNNCSVRSFTFQLDGKKKKGEDKFEIDYTMSTSGKCTSWSQIERSHCAIAHTMIMIVIDA